MRITFIKKNNKKLYLFSALFMCHPGYLILSMHFLRENQ